MKKNEVGATCGEAGSYDSVVNCSVCGAEISRETIEVPATGSHTYNNACDADCNTCGTERTPSDHVYDNACDTSCNVCGVVREITHTPAEAVKKNEVGATCGEAGSYDSVVNCSVCGAEISRETIEVPATGSHTYNNACDADCNTCGTERTPSDHVYDNACDTSCNVCGVVREITHTPAEAVQENKKSATCTTDGSYDSVIKCSVCGYEISRETVTVKTTGHKAGEIKVENNVGPTCTTDGSYDNVTYCTVCSEETSRETITVDALTHTEGAVVVEKEVGATCTTKGSYDNVVYCTVCEEELSRETVTVNATGEHTPAEAARENESAATCGKAGSYDSVVKCSVCGTQISRETIEVPATGKHMYDNACDADCNTCGTERTPSDHVYDNTCDTSCNVCGATRTTTHTPAEAVRENESAATCCNAGSYDSVVYCSVCGEEIGRDTITIPATGNHTFTNYVSDGNATCLADGTQTAKCDNCDATDTIPEEGSELGHEFKNFTSNGDATCVADGTETAKCERCDVTYSRTDVDSKLGHDVIPYDAKPATCIEEGWDAYEACSRCNYSTQSKYFATHTDNDDNKGVCDVCGDEICDHNNTVKTGAVEATCANAGNSAYWYCSDCEKYFSDEDCTKKIEEYSWVINSLPHNFTLYVSDRNATCAADGTKTAKCDNCDAKDTQPDVGSKLNHIHTSQVTTKPTCVDEGVKTFTCMNCGDSYTEAVPATGEHKDVNPVDNACDMCGRTMKFTITFVDYYGAETSQTFKNGANIVFPEPLTESHSFELEFLGWFDQSGYVVPEATATADATYTAKYKVTGFKTESLQLSVEYGAMNAEDETMGIIMYATLFVYTDAKGDFTAPIVKRAGKDVEEIFSFTNEQAFQTITMYRFAFTAEDIAENETFISIGVGDYARHINQVLFKYADALSGIVNSGEGTEAVMTAQQKLIDSMIRYGGAVQDCFEEDDTDVKTYGMLAATSDILSSFDKLDAERIFRDDDNPVISTNFEAATGIFDTMISLEYYYTVNVENVTSVGVIVADSVEELETLHGDFNAATTSTATLYSSETKIIDGKSYYVSTTEGMTINEIEDKYAVIYVTYTVGTETYHHYGDIVEYGIERFAQRQIFEYSPEYDKNNVYIGGEGKVVSSESSYSTEQYVNMLLRILKAHEAAEALEALRAPKD